MIEGGIVNQFYHAATLAHIGGQYVAFRGIDNVVAIAGDQQQWRRATVRMVDRLCVGPLTLGAEDSLQFTIGDCGRSL